MAEEEKDYPSALEYYALALDIYLSYEDKHYVGVTKRSIILMQTWEAGEAIERLDVGDEVKEALREILEETRKK